MYARWAHGLPWLSWQAARYVPSVSATRTEHARNASRPRLQHLFLFVRTCCYRISYLFYQKTINIFCFSLPVKKKSLHLHVAIAMKEKNRPFKDSGYEKSIYEHYAAGDVAVVVEHVPHRGGFCCVTRRACGQENGKHGNIDLKGEEK